MDNKLFNILERFESSYFRGHVWAFIGLVIEKAQKYYAVPLLGEMNIEKRNNENSQSMGTRIVYNALSIAEQMNCCTYLVLDAFFAIGPVFLAASAFSVALGFTLLLVPKRAQLPILILHLIHLEKEEERNNTGKSSS